MSSTDDGLTIVLPGLPPAAYSTNQAKGRRWYAQYRESHGKRGVFDDVKALVLEQGWQEPTMVRARVTVTFILPDRRKRDHDGLVQRLKPVLDALGLSLHQGIQRGAGVYKDDDLATIGWPSYGHCYKKGVAQTVIHVEPILRGE